MTDEGLPRFCREAQEQLPMLLAGELSGWPARVLRAHVRRCPECRAERERQERLAAALAGMKEAPPAPPEGLLEDLLATAARPGLRGRAAIPARGAVSGARPGLSVAFLTAGAVASTGVGFAVWRGARAARRRLHR